MSDNKIKKNYVFQLSYQVLGVLIPIITMPYVSRVLGAEGVGVYSYTLSLITYFTFFITTIGSYGQREIALFPDDKEHCSRIFYEIVITKIRFGAISALVYYFFACVPNSNNIIYIVQLVFLFGYVIDIAWFFQGKQEFKKTVSRSIFFKIVCTVAIFTFVKTPDDLALYVLIMSLSVVLSNLSLYFFCGRCLTYSNSLHIKPFRHLKGCIKYFIPCIALEVYTVMDKSMIQWLTGSNIQNGLYEQANKIIKICLMITTSLSAVKAPHITKLFGDNQAEEIKKSINQSFDFYSLLSFPICFGLFVVSENIIPWYLGSGFNTVIILLRIFSFIILFTGLSNIIANQYLIPVKQENKFTIATVIASVLNVIINSILIPRYGAFGAALASVVAEFIIFIVLYNFTRNVLDYKYLVQSMKKPFFAATLMAIVIYWLKYLNFKMYFVVALQVLFGVFIYFSVLLITKDQITLSFFKTLHRGSK